MLFVINSHTLPLPGKFWNVVFFDGSCGLCSGLLPGCGEQVKTPDEAPPNLCCRCVSKANGQNPHASHEQQRLFLCLRKEMDPGRILENIYDRLLYLGAIMTSGMMRLVRNRERETRQWINTGFSLDQTSERQRRKEMNVLFNSAMKGRTHVQLLLL